MELYDRLKSNRVQYELSILILTLSNRQDRLKTLLNSLKEQCIGKPVQILWLGDNKSMTVGDKRNALMSLANGRRVCFIDDDDYVSIDYIQEIFKAIPHNPDVITFTVQRLIDGKENLPQKYAKDYGRIHMAPDRSFYKMIPDHLCVWLKDVIKERFPSKNKQEDHLWAEAMKKHYVREYHIDKTLYFYNFSKQWSETR